MVGNRHRVGRAVAMTAAAALLVAAQGDSLLAKVRPGLWEVGGGRDWRAPQRLCLSDTMVIAQLQHRRARCERTVVRNAPGIAEVHYSCAPSEFGQSKISLVTPRSLRIETQGIADGAPFHYVVQARRVGECRNR